MRSFAAFCWYFYSPWRAPSGARLTHGALFYHGMELFRGVKLMHPCPGAGRSRHYNYLCRMQPPRQGRSRARPVWKVSIRVLQALRFFIFFPELPQEYRSFLCLLRRLLKRPVTLGDLALLLSSRYRLFYITRTGHVLEITSAEDGSVPETHFRRPPSLQGIFAGYPGDPRPLPAGKLPGRFYRGLALPLLLAGTWRRSVVNTFAHITALWVFRAAQPSRLLAGLPGLILILF